MQKSPIAPEEYIYTVACLPILRVARKRRVVECGLRGVAIHHSWSLREVVNVGSREWTSEFGNMSEMTDIEILEETTAAAVDTMFVLFSGYLVFMMQNGFAMVSTFTQVSRSLRGWYDLTFCPDRFVWNSSRPDR